MGRGEGRRAGISHGILAEGAALLCSFFARPPSMVAGRDRPSPLPAIPPVIDGPLNPAQPMNFTLFGSRALLAGLSLALMFGRPALGQGGASEATYPRESWQTYANPEQAGFSQAGLDGAKRYYDSLHAAAAMIVYDGAVLAAWGDVQRRFMCHSVRKSFMSAAWGARVDRAEADLSMTLAELGIDDLPPKLSEVEKRATILDLLQARSGVYRLAAYESPQNPKPARHSHEPGTFWCYNNWDFNALLTIYQEQFACDFFESFDQLIASPIGMQDYRPRDGYLHYEPEKSLHPAYPFRMSARDMARFGLLYLRKGRWGERQVLSEAWVQRSQTSYSEAWGGDGYGLLWWTAGDEDLKQLGMYSALGAGGHAIDVLPGADLVLVFRVDTFAGHSVSSDERKELLRRVLAAKVGPAERGAQLVDLETTPRIKGTAQGDLARYTGAVTRAGGLTSKVELGPDGGLILSLPRAGHFDLIPNGGDSFRIADMERDIVLRTHKSGGLAEIVSEADLNRQGYELLAQGELERALEVFRRNADLYPQSANARDSLGEALEQMGMLEAAASNFAMAVELETASESTRGFYRANLARVRAAQSLGSVGGDLSLEATLDALYSAFTHGPGEKLKQAELEALFLPSAVFVQPARPGAERKVDNLEVFLADFRAFLETPDVQRGGIAEHILASRIDQFGDIAHAYVAFQPVYGAGAQARAMRGLDSFQLVRTDGRWRVVSMTTQFESEDQVLPERFVE